MVGGRDGVRLEVVGVEGGLVVFYLCIYTYIGGLLYTYLGDVRSVYISKIASDVS